MPFRVSDKTLARLEWPELAARLAAHARTPQGQARLAGAAEPGSSGADAGVFARDAGAIRARLAETSEARRLLDTEEIPPLAGAHDLGPVLGRLGKGGHLEAAELVALGASLTVCHATRSFLADRGAAAPRLADRAESLSDLSDLAAAIAGSFDPDGEVRDDASPALAAARRDCRSLATEIQQRIGRYLQDTNLAPALSDSYFTVRGDRYVLPVRSEFRGRVPGIVHDASASGTTVFIEPQALVDLNNRLKEAELGVQRETRRVLRALSDRAGEHADAIAADLATLAELDVVFARGRLSQEMDAIEPEIADDGVFVLLQLRHPLLPANEVVPNDLRLGEGYHVLVVSGPNAGGKTVAMKALALAALLVRAGLHVPAAPGARVAVVDAVLADIGDEQDLRESLSTFSAHMTNLAEIVREAGPRSLVVVDEVGVGTDPGEGAALAQSVLERLADAGARVVATTHYNLLKEMAAVDERFENASVDFDPETLAPTYRLRTGMAGSSSATAVAARMGMPAAVVERASALLEREDRQLDRMLAELAASRASLERERHEAAALRAEGETARDEYRRKLERLQERRDALFAEMRGDLERAFRTAHSEVAGVIRELQRGGSAQDAARAREKLLALSEQASEAEHLARDRAPEAAPDRHPVDWQRIQAGDPVAVPGGEGVLLALPDRRGRVSVQVGTAKLSLPAERVHAAKSGPARPHRKPVRVQVERGSDTPRGPCDLRGLRVDDALARLESALDEALGRGAAELTIVHGVGTGALMRAVRGRLRELPFVTDVVGGGPDQGGDGITTARLGG